LLKNNTQNQQNQPDRDYFKLLQGKSAPINPIGLISPLERENTCYNPPFFQRGSARKTMSFHIVLLEPEIPPNTGNIMRLCANTGCTLHLIKPLGFSLSDKQMRRANLDYQLIQAPQIYESFSSFTQTHKTNRLFLCSTKATTRYTDMTYLPGDTFVFGPETRGLPEALLAQYPDNQKLVLPMVENSRSLNLANAVSVFIFEAWRQIDFKVL